MVLDDFYDSFTMAIRTVPVVEALTLHTVSKVTI